MGEVTRYRIRILRDDDFVAEGCNGRPLPEPREVYEQSPMTTNGGAELSYEAYLRYHGDPGMHVGLAVLVDVMRPGDDDWHRNAASVWGIDAMRDNPEVDLIGAQYYRLADMPEGYVKDTAAELLREVGA